MLKTITKLALVAGTLALSTSAMAGGSMKDEAEAPFSWTGFYAGVHAGYAWSKSDVTSTMSCPDGLCAFTDPVLLDFIGALGSGSLDDKGFTGGVQLGYNVQSGSAVYGIEMDISSLDISGAGAGVGLLDATVNGVGQLASAGAGVEADWMMTFRGRLGMTLSPAFLVYVTGGLALTDVEVANAYVDDGVGAPGALFGASSKSDLKLGWTLGAGMEVALGGNWSLKGEYLYVDFGSISTTAAVSPDPVFLLTPNAFRSEVDLSTHIARAGVNYKF